MKHPKQPRTPEVKTVTLRFKTTLTNAQLAEMASSATSWMMGQMSKNMFLTGTTQWIAKPRVEAVGKR